MKSPPVSVRQAAVPPRHLHLIPPGQAHRHQPAAIDRQASSSSWRKWASTGWLVTCLCLALVFGWWATGQSGSLAQPVHAASPSAPAISPAVSSAGSLPLVPIESVTTAHEVLAFDPATGRTAWKPVLQSFRRTSDHLRHLTVASADGRSQNFETTDEHPFWSVDQGEWVAAGSLQVGDRFQSTDGSLHVLTATRYKPHPDGMPVFNFEVEDYHSYFVSAHGSRGPPLLVHDADCGPESTVTRTNAQLVHDIAKRAEACGTRRDLSTTGSVEGTLKHGYAERLLTRYQRVFGDRGLSTEVRYINGHRWRPGDGLRGSVRLDVVEVPLDNPTAVFDYKFGNANLSNSRIDQIRRIAGLGSDVPVAPIYP